MNLPLPLDHSWPLFEEGRRFDLGLLHDESSDAPAIGAAHPERLTAAGIGLWACRLPDDALTWTAGVFDLFGLPRGTAVARDEAAALYAEPSRAVMERLRAYAVTHRRGFTLDAQILPATGPRRWMRLIAAPVCAGPRVVGLHGIKRDLTAARR